MATNNSGNFSVVVNAQKQMTFSTTPGFCVINNGYVNDVTGDGTLYTPCRFNVELLDRGSNFLNNTFTAPVSGVYLLSMKCLMNSISGAMTESVASIKTTSLTFSTYIFALNWAGNPLMAMRCFTIAYMASGDTAIAEIKINGGTKVADYFGDPASGGTSFSGVLIS